MKNRLAKGLIPHPDLSWLSVETGKLTPEIQKIRDEIRAIILL